MRSEHCRSKIKNQQSTFVNQERINEFRLSIVEVRRRESSIGRLTVTQPKSLSGFILHPSSFILHPSSFILHPSSFNQDDLINHLVTAAVVGRADEHSAILWSTHLDAAMVLELDVGSNVGIVQHDLPGADEGNDTRALQGAANESSCDIAVLPLKSEILHVAPDEDNHVELLRVNLFDLVIDFD